LNTAGTIDADFRDEIKIILANISNDDFVVKGGERIAQMVINCHEKAEWIEVVELTKTERKAGGLESTVTK